MGAAAGRQARRGARPPQGRRGRAPAGETVWLFGIHAVRDALSNPARVKRRLILTPNARQRLGEAVEASGIEAETADPRRFPAPLDPQSVHQGAALEVEPLDWGALADLARPHPRDPAPVVVCLDRVTDPHNVGAILRSAAVFGARAVVAPRRHAPPETGALAKAASGALERQPYLRVGNLADALETLGALGFHRVGLAGEAEATLAEGIAEGAGGPLALVLGAEGPGLRERTRACCERLVRIAGGEGFGTLNVSNAAAVALYAAAQRLRGGGRST